MTQWQQACIRHTDGDRIDPDRTDRTKEIDQTGDLIRRTIGDMQALLLDPKSLIAPGDWIDATMFVESIG